MKGENVVFSTSAFNYINVLDKAADASWLRETAIANNLSNANTPGYKRQDVDFESVLQRELGNTKYTSLNEKVKALNSNLSSLNVSVYRDSTNYSYRLDENNVDADTEAVELASETIRYQALTDSISSEFSRMQAVLK